MKKHSLKKPNFIFITILMTILFGFLIGMLSTNKLAKEYYSVERLDKSYVQIFINAFTLNYWYFFLLWLLGLMAFGFILSYFIIFFKSFMTGVTFGICLKSTGVFGIVHFLKYGVLEIVIILPILLYVGYKSISLSFEGKNKLMKGGNYFNVILIATILIVVYALLVCIKLNALET